MPSLAPLLKFWFLPFVEAAGKSNPTTRTPNVYTRMKDFITWMQEMSQENLSLGQRHDFQRPAKPNLHLPDVLTLPPEQPNVVRLRYGQIGRILDNITINRKPGVPPLPMQQLLQTLQTHSRTGNQQINWDNFDKLCRSYQVDPVELYRKIA
jgi:hypothetical protein